MPYDWLSVEAALAHHGRYYDSWDQAEANRLLEQLELDAGVALGALSSGQRRRFQLISALAHRPPVLLLDEPLAHLDPAGMRLIPELIRQYRELHPMKTILLATHAPDAFSDLADGVISLGGGVAAALGSPTVMAEH
jgi:ABC-2 type transport system ATP-binding protein